MNNNRSKRATHPRFTQLSHQRTCDGIDGTGQDEETTSDDRNQVKLSQMWFKSRSIESDEVESGGSGSGIQQRVPIPQESPQTTRISLRSVNFSSQERESSAAESLVDFGNESGTTNALTAALALGKERKKREEKSSHLIWGERRRQ